MPVSVKLYGGKKERFEEIKEDLAGELGYEPTNPEVLGVLMAMAGGGEQSDLVRGRLAISDIGD